MMKKKILIVLLVLSFAIYPLSIQAKTIKEFENEVANYTAQLQDKKNKIAKNDQEVAEIKQKIAKIESQIAETEKEIKRLEEEIDASNKEIEKKSTESKKVMEYYQISNGENLYLEYVFGAQTITDMIYRMSIIEQLTEYNDKIMKELKELIEKNNRKKEELKTKKDELNKLEASLESEKERINADTKSIRETMPALEQQIKSAQDNVNYYKKLGCGATEDIFACQYRIEQERSGSGGSIPSTNGFYRPMTNGYITQNYGGYGGHLGMDLSSYDKSIELYPIADGQVFYKGNDAYGALVLKIKHNVNGRYIYSTYAHMRNWAANINVGSYISHNTSFGNMGSTGYSTGPHLHLEITTCDWNKGGGCTWYQYQRSTINPRTYINFPASWNNR